MNSNFSPFDEYEYLDSDVDATFYDLLSFWINGVLSLTLVIIGTLGNAAVVLSLHCCQKSKAQPKRRHQAFYFYLMTFAFWNTGLLIATVLFNCIPVLSRWSSNFGVIADISFLIGYPLGNCCLTANVWLAVVVTVERYLAVSLPFHSTRLTSPRRRAKTISIVLSLGAILYNLPLLFELSLHQRSLVETTAYGSRNDTDRLGSGNGTNYHASANYQFETTTSQVHLQYAGDILSLITEWYDKDDNRIFLNDTKLDKAIASGEPDDRSSDNGSKTRLAFIRTRMVNTPGTLIRKLRVATSTGTRKSNPSPLVLLSRRLDSRSVNLKTSAHSPYDRGRAYIARETMEIIQPLTDKLLLRADMADTHDQTRLSAIDNAASSQEPDVHPAGSSVISDDNKGTCAGHTDDVDPTKETYEYTGNREELKRTRRQSTKMDPDITAAENPLLISNVEAEVPLSPDSASSVAPTIAVSESSDAVAPVYEVRMSTMRDNIYYQFLYRVLANILFVSGLPFLVILLLTIKIVCLVRESDRRRLHLRLTSSKSSPAANTERTNLDRPNIDRSNIDCPVTEPPNMDRPIIDRSQADWSAIDRPNIDQSHTDRPIVDQRNIDRLILNRSSIDHPHIDRSIIDRSSTDRPTNDQVRTEQRNVERPIINGSTISRSHTDRPGFDRSWSIAHIHATRSISPASGSSSSTSSSWRHAHVILTLIAVKFLMCYSLPVAINIVELTTDHQKFEEEQSTWSKTLAVLVDLSNLLIVVDGASNAFFYFSWWRSRIRLRNRFVSKRKITEDNNILGCAAQEHQEQTATLLQRQEIGRGGSKHELHLVMTRSASEQKSYQQLTVQKMTGELEKRTGQGEARENGSSCYSRTSVL